MKVLQTRCIGLAPDPQRLHDARPQIVYEVVGEYETRPKRKASLFTDEDERTKFDDDFDRWARVAIAILLALFLVNSWFL